jgi:hypothetical protein
MMDAVHDEHRRLAIPRDHHRIARPGPAVSSPLVPNFSLRWINPRKLSKKLFRGQPAEPIWENASGPPLRDGAIKARRT